MTEETTTKDVQDVQPEESMSWPDLDGTEKVTDGDGIVPSRPYSVRKSSLKDTSFAVAATAVPGVCVKDSEDDVILYPQEDGLVEVHEGDGVSPSRPWAQRKSVIKDTSFAIIASGTTGGVCVRQPESTEDDKTEDLPDMEDGDACSMLTPGRENKRQNGPRFKDPDEPAFTITTADRNGVAQNANGRLRIRYLTPLECWRLQAFPDEAYYKAVEAGMCKTAAYKQAGNSITVNVLANIFDRAFTQKTWKKRPSLEDWGFI